MEVAGRGRRHQFGAGAVGVGQPDLRLTRRGSGGGEGEQLAVA